MRKVKTVKRLTKFALCMLLGFAATVQAERVAIADVQVQADDTFGVDPTGAVMTMCSVTKGMTADQMDIQTAISNDVKALMATPLYSKVDAAIGTDAEGNWVVIYTVVRRPQLAEDPAINGIDGVIRRGKAEDAVKLVRLDKVDDAIASAAAKRLEVKLHDEGFVDATVDYEIRFSDEPGYAFLTLNVTPGVERSIRNYDFEGNTAFDHATLAGAFGWMPLYNPISWFADFPLSNEKLDDARAASQAIYTEAGYLDAEIAPVELKQVEGKQEGRVDAIFKVTEGPLYTIGDIKVEGATVYPTEAIEAAARAVIDTDGATATSATLNKVREEVELYYTSRGYVDTFASPTMIARIDEPVIDIVYQLTEGEQARIRNIEIRGNAITQDKVIRRELVIQPGELYDGRLVKRSESRIRNLNYFQEESGVTSYTVKTPNEGERDLVFTVREDRTLDTSFGLAFSTVDSVFLYAKATQRNFDLFNTNKNYFRGGGQRASVGAEIGARRQTLDVSWTQPWLFDMPLSFTVNGYRKLRWFDHYDEIRTGAAFTLSWKPIPLATPFGEFQMDRLGVRYTIEQVGYDDEDSGTWYTKSGDPFRFTDQDDGINSKFRFFWEEDHRNRPYFTTEGWTSLVYVDVGAGGDAKDYGFGFNFSKWWDMWEDHVLLTRLRFDTVEAYSGDVPLFDRLFIGGGRTVRGFEFRDGGPKAYSRHGGDHVAIGGQSAWCATVEYSIPIVSVLRFAVFSDIGSASEDFCDLGDDLLWSAGCGLRLDIKGFPIRMDFAKPLTNDDDTEEEVFTFWISVD